MHEIKERKLQPVKAAECERDRNGERSPSGMRFHAEMKLRYIVRGLAETRV